VICHGVMDFCCHALLVIYFLTFLVVICFFHLYHNQRKQKLQFLGI